ncbi:hypothetical protein [Mesorhizobium carmichaelinearum]|uniref:hypothetical protein n=1 Tax=Mesorhizobium carmichaelinearum TaxID=1208188 RepID=UPI00117F19F8|nr:hypothetical protein [Mesorhizobium carmichaelinearum]
MDPKRSVLERFLERNSINSARPLPIVHTTDAYITRKSIETGKLSISPCDRFEGENLLYFFVGRAAYKKNLPEEVEYWELPSCLVFDFQVKNAKRLYPFDSGAFKTKRYPNYVSMMDLDDFSMAPTSNNVERAIGAFFQSNLNYYRLAARRRADFEYDHDVGVLDEEIKALYKLIEDKSRRMDDRRFSIELQFEESFMFSDRKPLLIIIPETYLKNQKYVDKIYRTGETIETYPVYPLRKDYYYYAIYEKLDSFYRESGFYEI